MNHHITGRIQQKNNYWYLILNLKNEEGKYRPKWISTGLKIKGNKKHAERLLRQAIIEYEENECNANTSGGPQFTEFMSSWLNMMRPNLAETTYSSYDSNINRSIIPYFKRFNLTLSQVRSAHIQDYYTYLLTERKLSAKSVNKHHTNIRKALQYAFNTDQISYNPADKVEKPKPQPYVADHYTLNELSTLLSSLKGKRLELPVMIAAYYGFRRGEVLGLKWSAIDFSGEGSITVRHTITVTKGNDGKRKIIKKNSGKNKSSHRTLPLLPAIRKALLDVQQQQQTYKQVCGLSYCYDNEEYIFVDELGHLLKPNYLSQSFPLHLEKVGMRRIRFHDLRHSCASLLINAGVPMKIIQEWLGHSNISTTANIYAHLDKKSCALAANVIHELLSPLLRDTTNSDFN